MTRGYLIEHLKTGLLAPFVALTALMQVREQNEKGAHALQTTLPVCKVYFI